jgi:competence CoiA-like predicted nuclease
MALIAQTSDGIKVYAPEMAHRRQDLFCRFCNQPMVFVDAELKIKHFRHKVDTLCDSEPETVEHEHYKGVICQLLKRKNVGEVHPEHSIGPVRADIYLETGSWRNTVFEIQATNYSSSKYQEKIAAYAFRKLQVVHIFVGSDFRTEVKPHVYSLKEIEKKIFNDKDYRDTVIGCYLEGEIVTIPSFKQKLAKGRSGHCTNRFIVDYKETKQVHLDAFLDSILERYVAVPFVPPPCDHRATEYQKSDKKIPRYKEVCIQCAKFIRWLPNKEAKALGLETPERHANNLMRPAPYSRG